MDWAKARAIFLEESRELCAALEGALLDPVAFPPMPRLSICCCAPRTPSRVRPALSATRRWWPSPMRWRACWSACAAARSRLATSGQPAAGWQRSSAAHAGGGGGGGRRAGLAGRRAAVAALAVVPAGGRGLCGSGRGGAGRRRHALLAVVAAFLSICSATVSIPWPACVIWRSWGA